MVGVVARGGRSGEIGSWVHRCAVQVWRVHVSSPKCLDHIALTLPLLSAFRALFAARDSFEVFGTFEAPPAERSSSVPFSLLRDELGPLALRVHRADSATMEVGLDVDAAATRLRARLLANDSSAPQHVDDVNLSELLEADGAFGIRWPSAGDDAAKGVAAPSTAALTWGSSCRFVCDLVDKSDGTRYVRQRSCWFTISHRSPDGRLMRLGGGISIGEKVQIDGLLEATEFNGCMGTVIGASHIDGRLTVELAERPPDEAVGSGRLTLSVQSRNLVCVPRAPRAQQSFAVGSYEVNERDDAGATPDDSQQWRFVALSPQELAVVHSNLHSRGELSDAALLQRFKLLENKRSLGESQRASSATVLYASTARFQRSGRFYWLCRADQSFDR